MKKLWLVILLVMVQFLIVAPASADNGARDRVIFGGGTVVDKEETVNNLVVLGGSATVLGRLTGDLVVFGGSATVEGQVQGSVVVFGGSANLQPAAFVGRDVVTFGGSLRKAQGAVIGGSTVRGDGGTSFSLPVTSLIDFRYYTNPIWNFFLGLIKGMLATIVLLVVGVLAIAFFPRQLEVTEDVLENAFWQSAGIGALTFAAAVLISPILIISIIGIPIALLLWMAFFALSLYALVATAALAGERVIHTMRVSLAGPVINVVVGICLIMLVVVPFNAITGGCLGTMLLIVVVTPGIGAAILSRFGTLHWRPGVAPSPPPTRMFPPPPPQPPPAPQPPPEEPGAPEEGQ